MSLQRLPHGARKLQAAFSKAFRTRSRGQAAQRCTALRIAAAQRAGVGSRIALGGGNRAFLIRLAVCVDALRRGALSNQLAVALPVNAVCGQ